MRTRGNNPKETHFHTLGTGVAQIETALPTFVFICPPVLLPSRHSKGKSLFWFRVTAILPWNPGLLSAHAIPCEPMISLACITCPWPPQRRRGTTVPALPKSTHHQHYRCGLIPVTISQASSSLSFSCFQDLYGGTVNQKTANAPPCTVKLIRLKELSGTMTKWGDDKPSERALPPSVCFPNTKLPINETCMRAHDYKHICWQTSARCLWWYPRISAEGGAVYWLQLFEMLIW